MKSISAHTSASRRPAQTAALLVIAVLLLPWAALRADDLTRQVQEELRKRNLFFGDIDGRPTPALSSALASYQRRKGFAGNGALNEETLTSFDLRAPATAPARWPDVPVLKSDLAVRPAAPAPSPAPPAAAVALERPAAATDDAARLFVERYLLAGQTNDPDAEAQFYASQVEYFDQGKVDRAYIERDIRRYDARWPERSFLLADSAKVMPGDEPGRVVVEVTYRFNLKGRKYSVQGKIGTTYTLVGERPEDWRIVRVKEQRLHR